MTAHLTLPYNWVDCTGTESCQELLHFEGSAEESNSYPREWVELLFGCFLSEDLIKFYNEDGQLHRLDGPAIIGNDGWIEWLVNGEKHRKDGPAVTYRNGSKEWWLNGKLHRVDGPAKEYVDGSTEWRLHGELHRIDGPAITDAIGATQWYKNGELHRDNGPAQTLPNGEQQWWTHGEFRYKTAVEKVQLVTMSRNHRRSWLQRILHL